MKTLLGILLLFCSLPVFAQAPWTNILAPNRATDWTQSGVTGGIPSWSQCSSSGSVAPYSGSPSTIINAVTANSGNNCYVLMGTGTFNLNAGIRLKGISGVELRGMGSDKTFLVFSGVTTCSGGGSSCVASFEDNNGEYPGGVTVAAKWTGDYSKSSTSIIVNNASVLNITASKTMLVLDQADTGYSGNTTAAGGSGTTGSAVDNGNFFVCSDPYNPTGPTGCSYNGPDGGAARPHRWQQEYVLVTGCTPSCSNAGTTTLTITPGLIHPNWSSGQSPEAWSIQASSNVGFRDFSVDMSAISSSTGHGGVGFNNILNFWARGLRVGYGPQSGFTLNTVLLGTVESNYVYNAGQSSLGVDPNPADPNGIALTGEGVILQNNIIQWTRDALFISNSSAGNVIAYNLVENCFESTTDLWPCMYDGHSSGIDYNLWEGNVVDQMAQDQTHGDHDFETYYRNFVTGWESCSSGNCGTLPTSKTSNNDAMQPLSYNRLMNAVGNVLGTHGVQDISGAAYNFTNSEWFWNGTGYGNVWNIGSGNNCSPAGGCAGGPIPIDPLVSTTDLRWANWDAFHASTQCNTGEVPSSISVYPNPVPTAFTCSVSGPASFYLSARPNWYSSSVPFPPIGPDVTGGNVGQCGGTPNTSGQYALLPATNANQCAGQGLNTAWAGHVNAIPAMVYYYALGGLPDGTGPILPFDGTSYYSGTPQASGPTYSPVAGTYSSTQSVSLSTATSGATMCYTTDGSTPTATTPGTCLHGTTYSTSISVSALETITALATKTGFINSPVTSSAYVIGNPTLAAPTFNKAGGAYLVLPTVTITVPAGSTGCYTTDGSTPLAATPGTCSHGTTYSTPVTIGSTNTTLKAIATETSFVNSPFTSATYTQSNIVLDTSSTFNGGNVNLTTGSCPAITPTAGDGMVVEVEFGTFATFVSVTDNVNSGSYTAAIPVHFNSTIQQYVGVYYKSSVGASPTTITLTMSGPNNFVALACQAWKPLVPGIFVQDTAFTQQQDVLTTANPNTGSTVSPTNNNELVIGSLLSESQLPSSAGSGYTLLAVLPGAGLSSEYQVQSTSTATNAPWVMVSDSWTAQQSAFFFTPPPSNLNVSISGSVKFVGSVGVQ